jgi:hypothetical protein
LARISEELASTRTTLKLTKNQRDDAACRVNKLIQGVDTACKEVACVYLLVREKSEAYSLLIEPILRVSGGKQAFRDPSGSDSQ